MYQMSYVEIMSLSVIKTIKVLTNKFYMPLDINVQYKHFFSDLSSENF